MNTLSKNTREILKKNFYFDSLEVDTIKTSENGQTTKILFKTKT